VADSGPETPGPLPSRNPAFLHPVGDGAEEIELVECRLASAAMAHSGHQEEAAPALDFLHAAVVLSHALVIAESVEEGEPRVARAVLAYRYIRRNTVCN